MSRLITRCGVIACLAIGFWGTVIPAANAYIDPQTGSMIVQVVIGFFAAIGAGLVVFRDKVRGLFSRKSSASKSDAND